jgi:hypothetical protein
VPLSFAPGEAYQFDWSHEVVLLSGVTVIVKVAHVRLCHSRMLFVRVYPRETQEIVFDAHDRAFALFKGRGNSENRRCCGKVSVGSGGSSVVRSDHTVCRTASRRALLCQKLDPIRLSVQLRPYGELHCGGKWAEINISADPLYQHLLLTAEKKFWRCVESGEPPRVFGVEPPRPRRRCGSWT